MASGKLLVLLGDECKKQNRYRGLDKEYEIQVLLGFSTDTGDALGMPAYDALASEIDQKFIKTILSSEVGTKEVPYPAYSSKTVNGKPLFQYALEGTLEQVSIPTHPEIIYTIAVHGIERIGTAALRTLLESTLAKAPRAPEASKALGADFRQDQIRSAWEVLFTGIPEQEFLILKLRVACASGTYMRTLAERIGKQLGTEGLALAIHRTRIGRYVKFPLFGFWTRSY